MLVRTIRPEDAEQLVQLKLQIDQETTFMLFEPGERKMTVREQRGAIERLLADNISMIFVAEHEGRIIGFLSATGSHIKRIRHTLYIVIGILKAFTGQGIGTQLFTAMEEWASQQNIHRLELTVMTPNEAGIALYKKRGFSIEGTRKHACFKDYDDAELLCQQLGISTRGQAQAIIDLYFPDSKKQAFQELPDTLDDLFSNR